MSREVSLYHACAKALSSLGSDAANSMTSGWYSPSGSRVREMSEVSIITACRPLPSADGAVGPAPPLTRHWEWLPGPRHTSYSNSDRYWKYLLSHLVGVAVHGPSKPDVNASPSLPVPHLPGHGFEGSSFGDGPAPAGQAPCVLPNACPPPISATVSESFIAIRANVSRTARALPTGSGTPSGPSGLTYMRPTVVEPSGGLHVPLTGHGASLSCTAVGPSSTLSEPSSSSIRPPQKPSTGPPIVSIAVLPARMIRSPHDSERPCFSLIGQRSERALSRLVLSAHERSGSKRWRPPSAPPLPSEFRYEPELCHASLTNRGA
mmetsp:Transcript_31545/g.54000  ORF Transcript_31545/g.54000 Transcript_31545/m.54000 type:complete len:320 (+) Transcript_31545:1294-2253(+)